MRILSCILFLVSFTYSQTPVIEPGVSQELATWRAARYSDVRYNLNLTLEKMSPVLKGTMEIRVVVRDGATRRQGEGETGRRRDGEIVSPAIILDWRKIRGHEEKSSISNVSINGIVLSPALTQPSFTTTHSSEKPPEGGTQNTYEESNEHLIFRDGVVAGENVIKFDFTSPILTSGSAITRYVDKEDGAEYIYSLFVPSDASTAFPVFDQPDLKARFKLTVETEQNWKVISNTEARFLSKRHCEGEIRCLATHGFYETQPISTYVFAFAAGPFESFADTGGNPSGSEGVTSAELGMRSAESNPKSKIENPKSGDTLPTGRVSASTTKLSTSIYVRKSQLAKFQPHAAEVFRLNREAVKYFEEYFDYKFPFPKYDLVLIPEFPFGGMEHAGATFLRESAIIFPQEPTKNDLASRATLIFHEAAHQWFGDTVTMRWFDDLWLKEGFATFTAYKAMEKIMPEMNSWKIFYERIKQGAYQTDSTKGTTAIYQPIANLSAAKSAYGNIVYNKAPAFLRQAEFYLGEDKFRTAVRAFLKKHEFGNAGWEDLVGEFESESGEDLNEWAEFWVKRPGLAKVRISQTDPKTPPTQIPGYITLAPHWPTHVRSEGLPANTKLPLMKGMMFARGSYRASNTWIGWVLPEPVTVEGFEPIMYEQYFIFPNYQDYGYGIFLLDDKSRDYVLKNIQNEKDDFLRSMMWGSLWDSVREGELDPNEYVELVVRVLSSGSSRPISTTLPPEGGTQNGRGTTPSAHHPADEASAPLLKPGGELNPATPPKTGGESDESTIATLLGRVGTAMNYYISADSGELRTRVETLLIDRMRNAPTLGQRITFYRAFLNIASTDTARSTLKDILNLKFQISDLKLKTKDQFDVVTRLLILGDPDAHRLLSDLEKTETSDDAKRYAYAARAGIANADNKTKFWNDFTTNKDISESWIEAAFGPFNSVRHADLTLPYLERALKELPNHKRNRKIFFVNGWLGAFIGGQRSEEALAIVNKFLTDNPNLDRDLRLKILENVDVIERAVKIRARYATR